MKHLLLAAALTCGVSASAQNFTPLTVRTAPSNSVRIGHVLFVKSARSGSITAARSRVLTKIERDCTLSMTPSEPVRKKYGGPSDVAIAYCATLMIDQRNRSRHDLVGITAVALSG